MRTVNRLALLVALAGGMAVSGCETHTGTGAAAGAAGGAAAGVLTGGSAVRGAVVGGAGGAIVGGAVERDENANKCFERGVEVACPPK